MLNIGDVTANAKKKTALPFPSTPYAGAAPITTSPTTPAPISTPGNVNDALKNTNQTLDQAKGSIAATQPFLDNYLKPNAAGTTPFRQALTNTKASSTADAYDNAVARTREKAQAMGFSSTPQPVTFGAETGLANERAKAIIDIPNQVNLQAQPVEFQAAGMQQNQAGIYDAIAGTQQGEANILAQQKAAADAQKAGLASGIASTAIGVGAPLLKSALTKTVPAVGATAAGIGAAGAGTAATGGIGAALGSAGLPIGTTAAGVGGGATAGLAPAAPALAGGAGGGGGLGATIAGLATNPITIAVAGALVGLTALLKSQAHHEANTWVQGFQNPFDQKMNELNQHFAQAAQSGQLSKAQATQIVQEATAATEEYKRKLNEFSQQGSDENEVAHNARATADQYYGPNFSGFLGNLQNIAAGLA